MAKKDDPTVTSAQAEATEGIHPARPASETAHAADARKYRDLPDSDKPDPSTVAQEEITRPDGTAQ